MRIAIDCLRLSIVRPRLQSKIVYPLDTFGPCHLGFSKKPRGTAVPAMQTFVKASLSSHIEPQKILNRCLAPIRENACKNPNRWVAPIGETHANPDLAEEVRRSGAIGGWHQLGEMHAHLGPWHGRPGHANLGKASLSSHIQPQKILNRCLAPISGNACKNPNRWVAPIGETHANPDPPEEVRRGRLGVRAICRGRRPAWNEPLSHPRARSCPAD